ncbi:MAG: hypothetical protein KatS3mg015_2783 [Fimbriimonadales bacterium]|nr:MAG: hypothetical protein KatS3mg015_2783 [Fimbriimonadales bacterium]
MGGSGGSSSGKIDYPVELKTEWRKLISANGVDNVQQSVFAALNAAVSGISPYATVSAYNPTSNLVALDLAADELEEPLDLLSQNTGLDTYMQNFLSDTAIQDSVDAYKAVLDEDLAEVVLPRFKAGMRDVCAVVTSAFVTGQLVLEGKRDRQVAQYQAQLRLARDGELGLRIIGLKLEFARQLAFMKGEMERIKIVAMKEYTEKEVEYDVNDALWDISLYQHAANVLGSIGGGTSLPSHQKPNPTASALGGAMSGAAAGAMVSGGNPVGAVIGGVIGAVGGYLAAQ